MSAVAVTMLACVEGAPTDVVDIEREIVRLVVAPHTPTLALGDSIVLSAVGVGSDSLPAPTDVTWTAAGGTVEPVGRGLAQYRPIAAGRHVVRATRASLEDSATVVVTPVPVAVVDISPAGSTILVGGTTQFNATPRSSNGTILSDRPVTWATGNGTVASVDATGQVTGVGPGTTSILATSESQTALATVVVSQVPVASVVVTPASLALLEGASAPLTATPRDASGNDLLGRVVAWSSSNGAVASVNASGLVSAGTAGTANVTATSEGRSTVVPVTVTAVVVPPAIVASVTVVPATLSLQLGQSAALGVVVRDASGTALASRAVSWSSSAPATVGVSPSGIVTALVAGTATILATSDGVTGTASVTVTGAPPPPAPVATVTVNPAVLNITVGQTFQLGVTLRDAATNILSGRLVTFATNAPAIATVNTSGRVSAVAPGAAVITVTSEGQTGTVTVNVSPVPVASVLVTPATASASVGQTVQLTATPRDAAGNALIGRVVTWATSSGAIANVSIAGLVTAIAPGPATITATSEGQSGTATVTVAAIPVASVTVNPSALNLISGQTGQITATPRDAGGGVLTGRTVTWSTSAPGIATVSATGLVTAGAPGSATITATSEGRTNTVAVTVMPVPVATVTVTPPTGTISAGQTGQAIATLRDAAGNILTGRLITWTTSAPTVATVSPTGLVTGVGVGTATITATSEGKSGSVTITISTIPVASVTVNPTTLARTVGQTGQVTATMRDAAGNVLAGRLVSWTTNAAGVATVSAAGLVTAVGPGSATITATSEGQTATVAVTVILAPVATVTVAPTPVSRPSGGTVQLSATLRDAAGNVLTGRVVTWTSSDGNVALVGAAGLVTADQPGSATITATSEGRTGTAAISVTAAPVATVTLSPASLNLPVGGTGQLAATLRDGLGNILTGRVIAWTSSATGVASVSATGLVTGVAPGTATITATSEGRTATASATITAAPVASITLNPTTLNLSLGASGQITPTLRDAAGNVLTGRVITWTSSAPLTATVTTTGLVTGLLAGSATITVTSEGKTATVSVTVVLAPVATVTLLPAAVTLSVGGSVQLVPTLLDAAGNALTGRVITWTTTASSVASVSSTGLVTAGALGTATIRATSEGQIGSSAITVAVISSGEPIFSASNPNHKLHAYEDWSKLTSIANIYTSTRGGDNGPAWIKHGGTANGTLYMTLVNQPDPFGSLRHVSIDFTADPPIAPHGIVGPYSAVHTGFHWANGGGDDNVRAEAGISTGGGSSTISDATKSWPANYWVGHSIYISSGPGAGTQLNVSSNTATTITVAGTWGAGVGSNYELGASGTTRSWIRGIDLGRFTNKPVHDAMVVEWAIRQRGTNWYEGKNVDMGAGQQAGMGRWLFDHFFDPLGIGGPASCTDLLCRLYYSNSGNTPLLPNMPPTSRTVAPAVHRSAGSHLTAAAGSSFIVYKQNKAYGTGAGQFVWGSPFGAGPQNANLAGTGTPMYQAGWLYNKIRITREPRGAAFVYGQGRLEMWIGPSPGSLTKVMEYLGDPGQLAAGKVWVSNTDAISMPDALEIINFFAPTARVYKGGAIVDLGTVRVWSHPRQ